MPRIAVNHTTIYILIQVASINQFIHNVSFQVLKILALFPEIMFKKLFYAVISLGPNYRDITRVVMATSLHWLTMVKIVHYIVIYQTGKVFDLSLHHLHTVNCIHGLITEMKVGSAYTLHQEQIGAQPQHCLCDRYFCRKNFNKLAFLIKLD